MSDSALSNMSKDQLIQLIIRRGEDAKREQFESTQILTQDAQNQVPSLMNSINNAIAKKEAKIATLEQQRENLNKEIRGLENSQEVCKAKIKKRKGQIHDSELEVKSIREKLGEIQKRITPEVIKALNKQLDKHDVMKLNIMLNSFTALVLNK